MSLKHLGKHTVIYAIGNVGARAAMFLLIPLYTHALAVEEFGLLATLQTTIFIMAILVSMGMRMTLLRYVKEYEEQGLLHTLLGTSLVVNIFGGAVVTTLAFTVLIPVFQQILHMTDVYPYVGMVCGAALAQALSVHVTSYYRAQQRAVMYMVCGIATALLLFVITYVLVYWYESGVTGAMIAFIVTHALIAIVASLDILRHTGMRISWALMPRLLRFGFPQICSQCTELVIGSIGVYLLSYFAGLEAVAIYSLGFKLAVVLSITTITPFSMAFEPYVFSNRDRLDEKTLIARSLTYMILAVVFASSCLIVAIRILLPKIAPPEYAAALFVVILAIPGMIFTGVYYFGQAILNAMNKARTIGIVSVVVAGISVLLNVLLIHRFDWYGAVIAFDVSFVLLGTTLAVVGLKHSSIELEWKRLFWLSGLLVSLLLALIMLNEYSVIRFSVIALLIIILGILLLLHYGFFDSDEKLIIRRLTAKLG